MQRETLVEGGVLKQTGGLEGLGEGGGRSLGSAVYASRGSQVDATRAICMHTTVRGVHNDWSVAISYRVELNDAQVNSIFEFTSKCSKTS